MSVHCGKKKKSLLTGRSLHQNQNVRPSASTGWVFRGQERGDNKHHDTRPGIPAEREKHREQRAFPLITIKSNRVYSGLYSTDSWLEIHFRLPSTHKPPTPSPWIGLSGYRKWMAGRNWFYLKSPFVFIMICLFRPGCQFRPNHPRDIRWVRGLWRQRTFSAPWCTFGRSETRGEGTHTCIRMLYTTTLTIIFSFPAAETYQFLYLCCVFWALVWELRICQVCFNRTESLFVPCGLQHWHCSGRMPDHL